MDFDHDVCRTLEQHVRTIVYVKFNEVAATVVAPPSASAGTEAAADHGFSGDGILMIRSYMQLQELQL